MSTEGRFHGDPPGPVGGPARRRRAQGERHGELQALLAGLDPQLATWADEFVFGEVWGRPGLSQDERQLVAITALASLGHPDQLRNYLWGAVQGGTPAAKIQEALVMLVVYAGFPRALGAVHTWAEVRRAAAAAGYDVALDHDAPG